MESAARDRTPGSDPEPNNVVTLDRPRQEPQSQPAGGEIKPEEPFVEAREAKKAPEAPAPATTLTAETPARKKRGRVRLLLPIGLAALLAGGGWYGYDWWTNGRFMISTDDAYIQADVATLGVKVSGYVADVRVKDGDAVKAGDVLVKLDDTDYRLALASAEAKRATQGATVARIERQVGAQEADIDSARAGIASAEAERVRAQGAYERAEALAQQSFQSKAVLDQSLADRDRAVAAVTTAKAALSAAEANLDVIEAQRTEAEQVAKELDTAVDKARSDLAATEIRAPSDGIVGNRAAQPGQYVAPGSRLMALVPLKSVYIAANFKETQLAGLKPGQTVRIAVDSIPDHDFKGTVGNFSPASGSTFSLLPPENATGNFTKITQRLPVRVEVPADLAESGRLKPGLSVVVSVDTRT
jgi:membrane fusion protein (multidrug efflux system)